MKERKVKNEGRKERGILDYYYYYSKGLIDWWHGWDGIGSGWWVGRGSWVLEWQCRDRYAVESANGVQVGVAGIGSGMHWQ